MLSEVFYLNLDSIELQAERAIDPTLKTRAVAIISSSDSNGTIISLSHEAEQEGLYKGMKVSIACLLYTSPSPRDRTRSRMPSSA